MDRRGWLWKKKSSDKNIDSEKPVAVSESVGSTLSSVAHLGDQDNCKNKNFVQISMESYSRMSGLEDQVVKLEDQAKALEAKLSAAYSELNNKDNLVRQHAKVAEEAVSGWEKADAEVLSLRHHLESITLSKLAVDDRASHLDEALKECMRQIRTVKEDSEQKQQEVILMKSQQWEKVKLELQAKIDKLDQVLCQEASENAALLRSVQNSSNKIARLEEEKSEAEAEVELLKTNVQSNEREINSLKYELHVLSKELDIRNEEKNIIVRSAEVANKQHAEDVKNIAKLETECQRLRGLLRKKLPGPAALAQMKLEVGSSHQVIIGPYIRKTYSKPDTLQESEFLTKQLEVLEEETKALKEALATSNAELQASRNLCAKTISRLKSLEAEIRVFHQEKSAQRNSSNRISNNPPSITSISDDGHEDPESHVESCAASISDLSDIRRVTSIGKFDNNKSETILELMDDFLEVEKMACLSENSVVPLGIISNDNDSRRRDAEDKQSNDTPKAGGSDHLPILKRLQSIISMITNSETNYSDIRKLFEDLMVTLFELRDYLPRTLECPLCVKSNPDDASSCHQSIKIDMPVTEDSKVDTKVSREDVSPGSELNFVSYKHSSEEFKQMESEKDDKASEHAEYMQDLKETKLMLQEKEQLLAELKEQLASSHKSCSLAEIQLKCMTESYKSLQTHAEGLEAQNKFLEEKIEELKNDLVEQKQCHHDALLRYREIEEKMERDKCLACGSCGSDLEADNGINTRKDTELAAAEKKLVECQETLYILGRQLQALCPQIDLSKRLQMNDMVVKPSHGWSNSYGSCNSNETDQAEACSVSSDIQGVNDELSPHKCGSTSCPSDSEGSFSLNSSTGSSQPGYMLTDLKFPSSAPATGKHAHGLSHFFSLKGKSGH